MFVKCFGAGAQTIRSCWIQFGVCLTISQLLFLCLCEFSYVGVFFFFNVGQF